MYLRHIDHTLFGAWLAASQAITWLALIDPGVSDLARQQTAFAYGRGDFAAIGRAIASSYLIGTTVALVPAIAGTALVPLVASRFHLPGAEAATLRHALLLASCATSASLASFPPGAVLQGLQRNFTYGLVYIAGSVIGIVSTVFLLSRIGLASIPLGLLLRSLVWIAGWAVLVNQTASTHHVLIRASAREVRSNVALSGYTFVGRISQTLNTGIDAFFVGVLFGPAPTTAFVFTGRLFELVRLLEGRISVACLPSLSHLAGEGNATQLRKISERLIRAIGWALAIGIGTAISGNRAFVRAWVGDKYFAGGTMTLLFALGAALSVLVDAVNFTLFAQGLIQRPAIASCLQGLAKLALALVLLRTFGTASILVAAIIAATGVLLWYVIVEWQAAFEVGVRQSLSFFASILLPVALACIFGLLWTQLPQKGGWAGLALRSCTFCVLAVAALSGFDRRFRSEIRASVLHLAHIRNARHATAA